MMIYPVTGRYGRYSTEFNYIKAFLENGATWHQLDIQYIK